MTYKQIEASREVRLWITQVIVPAVATAVAVVSTVPAVREAASAKFEAVKDRIKFKRRK